ncbi:hypothetical protein M0805_000837 [Coniferiporia weirii]|nr:hypothetical protein M0805_000837 [Coniferiporia weirii]
MSHTQRRRSDEVNARTGDDAQTEQFVGRPQTTNHDMHEDMMRSPPHNVPEGAGEIGGTQPGMKAPTMDEANADEIPDGVMGEDIFGRQKVLDAQNRLIDDSDSTFRP